MTAQQWLDNDGSFLDGLQILADLGGEVKPFRGYASLAFLPPGVKERLRDEVTKRLGDRVIGEWGNADRDVEGLKGLKVEKVEPPEAQQLREQGKRWLKRQADAHTRLKNAKDDTERYIIAEEMMMEIVPEVDRIYGALRAYERDGVLPATNEQAIVRDTIEKMKRIDTLESRISRVSGWLKAGKSNKGPLDDKQQQDYEQEVLEKRAELEDLKEKLD